VCRLIKPLYGLKQAPKQWHEKFNTILTSAVFIVIGSDKCVYYRYGGGEGVILCLYVDNILIFGTSTRVINRIKSFLSRCFDMKDLGPVHVILNIKLIKSGDGITLNQSHYAEKILSLFGVEECKITPTPYDASVKLRKFEGEGQDQLRYSQISGSHIYLVGAMRPDISYAISKLSRFTSNPGDDHWKTIERVLHYLRDTTSFRIHYS
jgi:hypothetical protein